MDQINFQTKIRKGPREQRECTDCWCALLLAVLLFGLLFLTVNQGSYVSVDNLGVPMDSSKQVCGRQDAEEHPFLFFPESTQESVCARECPQQDTGLVDCHPNSQFKACPPSQLTTVNPSGLCLPTNNPELRGSIEGLIQAQNEQVLAVLPRSFRYIMAGVGIETLAGVILATMMLLLPTLALLGFYVAGMLLVCAMAVLFLYEQVNRQLPFLKLKVSDSPGVYISLAIFFVLMALFMLGYLLLRCTQLHNLKVYLNNSAVFFRRNVPAMLVALATIGLMIGFFYGWTMALVHLTLAEGSDSLSGFYAVKPQPYFWAYMVVLIPALIWSRGFLLSLSEFIISAQTIFWYCQQKTCCVNLCAALGLALRYHVGSVAFAGITVANWPARLLTWSRRRVEALAIKDGEKGCGDFLGLCCCGGCYMLSSLSRFYHIETVLATLPFREASHNYLAFQERCRTYNSRDLYKAGIFAVNATKMCLITICLAATYLLLAIREPYVLQSVQALAVFALTLLMAEAAAEILTHPILLAGQVLNMCVSIDRHIE